MKIGHIVKCALCGKSVSNDEELKACIKDHYNNHFPMAWVTVSIVALPDDEEEEKPEPKPAPKKKKKGRPKVKEIENPEEDEEEEDLEDLTL